MHRVCGEYKRKGHRKEKEDGKKMDKNSQENEMQNTDRKKGRVHRISIYIYRTEVKGEACGAELAYDCNALRIKRNRVLRGLDDPGYDSLSIGHQHHMQS